MVSRLDLDGTNSPLGLVGKILKAEPTLKPPIPIEELALKLDIAEITELTTDGFEGGLVTDSNRTSGVILVKQGVMRQRRRFTIGHELGHFLNDYHQPPEGDQFLCSKSDMRNWDTKTEQRQRKMEAEANRFASAILMPPTMLRPIIDRPRYSTLKSVLEIAETFDVSKEAAARAYVEYNSENVAIIVARNGRYVRSYRSRKFPWIQLSQGDSIPDISLSHAARSITTMERTQAEYWIDTSHKRRLPPMFEQVLPQASGFCLIQLKMLEDEQEDFSENENLTSKDRLRIQTERWSR